MKMINESYDHLIFIMGIPTSGKMIFIMKQNPIPCPNIATHFAHAMTAQLLSYVQM